MSSPSRSGGPLLPSKVEPYLEPAQRSSVFVRMVDITSAIRLRIFIHHTMVYIATIEPVYKDSQTYGWRAICKRRSEAFARILKCYGNATANRPHRTLRNFVVHPKDKVKDEEKTELIYRVLQTIVDNVCKRSKAFARILKCYGNATANRPHRTWKSQKT